LGLVRERSGGRGGAGGRESEGERARERAGERTGGAWGWSWNSELADFLPLPLPLPHVFPMFSCLFLSYLDHPPPHSADDEEEVQKLSGPRFACCKGEGLRGTSHLGDYTPTATYRQKWGGSAWFGVRAFTLENLVAAPAAGAASPPASHAHANTHALMTAEHMGAPFAPAKWDRARLSNRARLSKVRNATPGRGLCWSA